MNSKFIKTLCLMTVGTLLLAACKPIVLFTIGGKKEPTYAGTELQTESTGKVEKE